ncbi:MAG: response regulator [Candidatus Aureabacteria bacterium]|nr:response regulator [Candidatus Auribacterota bacterium]
MSDEKAKILIIDDNQSSRYLYKTVLANTKEFNVILCANLYDGLKTFYKIQPDLVVLDMDLPDGTGVDFLKDIRAKKDSTKVIVISAIKNSDVIIQSAKLGIGTYLIKPVDINKFVEKVKEFTQEK